MLYSCGCLIAEGQKAVSLAQSQPLVTDRTLTIMCSILNKGEKIDQKIDDLAEDLEERIKDVEFKSEDRLKEVEQKSDERQEVNDQQLKHLQESIERNKEFMENLEEKYEDVISKQTTLMERVLEKVNDIETGRKNNLIFNGLSSEGNETSDKLMSKVKEIIKGQLNIHRPMFLTNVSRITSGPDVMGCRPVMVSFETFKDREEVLGSVRALGNRVSVSITEEFSKKTREARTELRKFVRQVKKNSPEKRCSLVYDKLFVDGKSFVFSEEEGRVMEQGHESVAGHSMDNIMYDSREKHDDLECKIKDMKKIINDQQKLLQKQFKMIEEQKDKIDGMENK